MSRDYWLPGDILSDDEDAYYFIDEDYGRGWYDDDPDDDLDNADPEWIARNGGFVGEWTEEDAREAAGEGGDASE